MKENKITLGVTLDDGNMPEKLTWQAEDNPDGLKEPAESKAILLSIYDKETSDTLKIDLWTKKMTIEEMDHFFFQTLNAMSDTYEKATKNKLLAEDMRKFVEYFGKKTEILK